MKTKFLYHGSIKKINGKLIPKKADDLENKKENLHKAVYSTSVKDAAIAMAIISCKGVIGASLGYKKPYGTIYAGWPKQKFIYLYTLLTDTFVQSKKGLKQWHSFISVKPLKIERLKVKDYLHLVRKSTEKEHKTWVKKNHLEKWIKSLK
ncbi:MAG: hypothetical protein Q7S56_00300 [Nanoarchaeota archaeon]|nr:hypothetical protein [Nanoarchaeota archaeon]